MSSISSNNVMYTDDRVARLDLRNLPSASQAVSSYQREGGRISEESEFGEDPLQGDHAKRSLEPKLSVNSFHPITQ